MFACFIPKPEHMGNVFFSQGQLHVQSAVASPADAQATADATHTFQHTSHLVTARVKLDQCLEQHVCDIFVLLAYTDADSAHLS